MSPQNPPERLSPRRVMGVPPSYKCACKKDKMSRISYEKYEK